MEEIRKIFNIQFALISLIVNTIAIIWANSDQTDRLYDWYVLAHVLASPFLAGFTMRYTQRVARRERWLGAYSLGSVWVALIAASIMGSVHWLIATPDLFWTAVTVFALNIIAGVALVFIIRNKGKVNKFIIVIARKAIRFVEGL